MEDAPRSSLPLRCLTALILAPVVLAALWFGWPIYILALVTAALAIYEWLNLSGQLPMGAFIGVGGIFYIVLCVTSFVLTQSYGIIFPIALILSVWASDSGAYLAGKVIGGAKLLPSISPNKTWAGLFGGMVASAAMLVILDLVFGLFSSVVVSLIVGACITMAGQLGDLIVSVFKRKADVKDTGQIIPGHGGILDRVDSLLLASPFFLLCLKMAFVG